MTERQRRITAGVLLLCGAAVMAGGAVFGGEAAIVLRKAIYVCLECIGIG